MTEDLQELLFALCAAPGTPGDESEAAQARRMGAFRLRRNGDRPHGKCHLPHRKPNRPTADSLGRPPGSSGLIVTRIENERLFARRPLRRHGPPGPPGQPGHRVWQGTVDRDCLLHAPASDRVRRGQGGVRGPDGHRPGAFHGRGAGTCLPRRPGVGPRAAEASPGHPHHLPGPGRPRGMRRIDPLCTAFARSNALLRAHHPVEQPRRGRRPGRTDRRLLFETHGGHRGGRQLCRPARR